MPDRVAMGQRISRFLRLNPLAIAAAAIIAGIVLDRGFELAWSVIALVLLATLAVTTRTGRVSAMGLLVLLVSVGALRHSAWRASYQGASLHGPGWDRALENDSFGCVVEGTVAVIPRIHRHPMAGASFRRDQSPWQTRSVLEVTAINSMGRAVAASGKLRWTVEGRADSWNRGDRVRVYGNLGRAAGAANPGGWDPLSMDENASIHGHLHVDSVDDVEVLAQGGGIRFEIDRRFKDLAWFTRVALRRHLGETQGRLASGMVIGARDAVPKSVQDQLLVTGTVHWLTVSGLHLAMVVSLVGGACRVLSVPRWIQVILLIGACVFYTALTGGRPPVIRAAVLVVTFVLAIHSGRAAQMINTLSLAAIVLVLIDPRNLFGIGVHLSFLAVATLMVAGRTLVAPRTLAADAADGAENRFDEMIRQGRSMGWAWMIQAGRFGGRLLWASACVTAVSMPLVWYHFHVVSPISVLVNVILAPCLFLALAMALSTVVAAMVHPRLADGLGTVAASLIEGMMAVIQWAATVPMGHHWLPSPSAAWVVAFYVGLAASLLWRPTMRLRWGRICGIAVWTGIALMGALRNEPVDSRDIEATVIDVGHGSAVVIRHQDQTWLYDCGWLGNDDNRGKDIEGVLWSMGIVHLDGIILSHADADHFNALPAITRRFSVGRLVTPPGMLAESEAALEPIRDAVAIAGIAVREVSRGDQIEPWMTVLHPGPYRTEGSDNANSLVVRIDHGAGRLILPGDLEPPGTAIVTQGVRPPPGSVLMAPHHGSTRMDAPRVLQFFRPSVVVVSGGRRARRPAVKQMLSAGGAETWVTAVQGAIRVRIDSEGEIETRAWRDQSW